MPRWTRRSQAGAGNDDATATLVKVYFAEQGVSRKYDVSLTDNRLV
ncbi:hypothetical protein [Cryptosporangium minutisporangium]